MYNFIKNLNNYWTKYAKLIGLCSAAPELSAKPNLDLNPINDTKVGQIEIIQSDDKLVKTEGRFI